MSSIYVLMKDECEDISKSCQSPHQVQDTVLIIECMWWSECDVEKSYGFCLECEKIIFRLFIFF